MSTSTSRQMTEVGYLYFLERKKPPKTQQQKHLKPKNPTNQLQQFYSGLTALS